MGKLLAPGSAAAGSIAGELASVREAAVAVKQIRLRAQRELELARQMRVEAQRYQQEMETKARSQVQQLILRTRLAARGVVQKEISEVVHRDVEGIAHNAVTEIHKMLADIRTIRITAQEELATLKKLIDAGRIYSITSTLPEGITEPETIEAIKAIGKKRLAGKE